ncbi:hypothetical protein GCM10007304_46680 [Rhodococcoides trifolii]|uniref:DUF4190 domain-containing protein n=1 Tax=Rhodococcoides trifolii TaxID=908250 RepID=A0A917G866_9NOCA|nr:DUF4190 domain-containing protein [Rhodococcus trifolii]GGG27512.1 hypothetical protein GCM10007304_46680 [Rhodococcus trifolii]
MSAPSDHSSEVSGPPDPINTYAVISLVAALLGLFPVAIVFGILAFWRPAGRGLAIAGVAIGVLELAAVLAVLFGIGNAFTDDADGDAFSSYGLTLPSSTFLVPTTVPTTTEQVTTPPFVAPTTTVAAPEPARETVTLGDYCSSRGASASTEDGSTAYCSRLAGTDAYLWSLTDGVAPNPELQQTQNESTGSVAAPGDPCYDDSATATDASGRAVYCNPTVNGRNAGNLLWQLTP